MSEPFDACALNPRRGRVLRALADPLVRLLGRGIRTGSLRVELPQGQVVELGNAAALPPAVWQLASAKALWRAYARGDLGFAESYLDGEWDSPDLTHLLLVLGRNERPEGDVLGGALPVRWLDRWQHWRRRNSPRQSARNIAYHYDLGNQFYREWLDPSMTYSSAMFAGTDDCLERAQQRKYQHLGDLIELAAGHEVLEVGCGWGGFAEHALKAGARVHGISLSREQTHYARQRLQSLDCGGQSELEIRDYRELDRRYDRIASIEMLEAVGERYWPAYAAMLKTALRPGGLAGVQTITIAPQRFARYRRQPDFIQRYIFPGGMLPSEPVLAQMLAAAGLRITRTQRFGLDYARTLVLWRERFEAAWPRIQALGFDERFRRLWRYYLCYCEAGFRLGAVEVVQLRIEHA
ncbi:MAG: class I SAM-dependent methyltransferase [Gammaproteobacteria bacterium]|nr:class I SAM-dependent methyltransferase [Gammaproteobacteria bacterium]